MKWDIKAILTLIAILVVGAAVCILALMMGPDIDEDSSSVLPENTTVSTLPTEAGSNENSSENSDDFKDEVANTTTNNKTDNMTTANSEPTQNNSSVTTTTNGTTSNKTTSKVTTTTTKKAPTTTKTQTTINSNTTFATYLAFVSDIQSGVYSLSQEPSALKELTPSCSCGIQFTGNFKDGSVKMVLLFGSMRMVMTTPLSISRTLFRQ